ncbi:hypothetical protein [Myxacorys almedinensis]|uniref:Uncharacterized protein n=1 Tax=Myxacorys almedinensis A TaxID=2690445 RepID=A0A8J8CNP0_9CYAN|nr:hypothetical protein [Myxacorys almedinensis]NDJ18632.1 hypothetical protein [Myxacorys almedinensis A]
MHPPSQLAPPLSTVFKILGVSVLLMATGTAQRAPRAIAAERPTTVSKVSKSAASPSALAPSPEPFDLAYIEAGICAASVKGITESSISESGLAVPSFWWVRDEIAAQAQFGKRLIDGWLACPGQNGRANRVDFLVNQQVWSLLDYLERYQFVHRLGTVAGDYHHNVRIFNRQGALLAGYTCGFSPNIAAKTAETHQDFRRKEAATLPEAQPALICSLALESTSNFSFRGRTTPDGFAPTRSDTAQP